ncbi:hypothetical protein G5B30_08955 [Sphingobacterium sp. SGG-5]|uniref:hypothetical protein n=1 Tax=Sphingobacterium sp. SGG-5 TaxID=2710881 RepID=UPI0013EBD09A|nr:hypothetical protein [Sphingobacterium sp. SGG-5]NGM62041.1 hypothetical protein [Sphingobacterium sp. SGG-5]
MEKKNKYSVKGVIGMLIMLLAVGCSKEDPDQKDDGDQFNPKFVDSNWGHYSGVLVGSTGYFNILVTGSGVSAVVVFDDEQYEMQSNSPVPEKQNYEVSLSKDDVVINFVVDKAGKSPEVEVEIPDHPSVNATIFKAEEGQTVRNYLGWSKSTNGQNTHNETYNMTIKGNKYEVVAKSATDSYSELGTIEWVGKDKVKIIAPETTILANVNPQTGVIHHKETGENNYSFEIQLTPQDLLLDDNPDSDDDGDDYASPKPAPGS